MLFIGKPKKINDDFVYRDEYTSLRSLTTTCCKSQWESLQAEQSEGKNAATAARRAKGLSTEGVKIRPMSKGERVKDQTEIELMKFQELQRNAVFTPGKKALMSDGKVRSLAIAERNKKVSDKENALKKQHLEERREAGIDAKTPPAFMRATASASARKSQVFKGSSDASSTKLFSNVTNNGAKLSKK